MVSDVALDVRGLTSAYEIRWSAVICIQTGLAGALLLPCRETHCSTSLQSTPCMQYLVHLYTLYARIPCPCPCTFYHEELHNRFNNR